MSTRSARLVVAALVLAVVGMLAPAVALAQEGTQQPVEHRQTVSANPFGLIVGWFNVEYERKLTERATWAVSASRIDIDDFDYTNGNVMFRFYPQGAALSGFFVGSRTGIYHIDNDDDSATAVGVGFELGYNWLLGANRNFDVSIGVGATRLFGDDLDGASMTLPTVRLVNLGFAF